MKLMETTSRFPAISRRTRRACHCRGLADGPDWSGTLVVISRGADVLTVLGMTYADNDLIQIQENVINRSMASLDFNLH